MTYEWIQNLCSVLDRMESLYVRVLPLLDRERSFLIELDYEKLYAELSEKDDVLATIRKLDRERLRFQDHFSTLTGKPAADISLRWLGEYLISLGGTEAQLGTGLLARRDRIERLVDAVKERVARNGRFIERSMSNIRSVAQDLSEALGHTHETREEKNSAKHQTYNGKAKVKKIQPKSGALVSKSL